ncbi:MAG: tail fiber protein [Myxococcota bacterium]
MVEGYIGEIRLFAGNFAPQSWAFCMGQILPIAQNTALFSILGTTYGGNGQTTFALPDLRGRTAIGAGQGAGLSDYNLGQLGGAESVTLLTSELPAHTHQVSASSQAAAAAEPTNAFLAAAGSNVYSNTPNTTMNAAMVGVTGSSQPHNNMPPYLALNYIICMFGIYPSRN